MYNRSNPLTVEKPGYFFLVVYSFIRHLVHNGENVLETFLFTKNLQRRWFILVMITSTYKAKLCTRPCSKYFMYLFTCQLLQIPCFPTRKYILNVLRLIVSLFKQQKNIWENVVLLKSRAYILLAVYMIYATCQE